MGASFRDTIREGLTQKQEGYVGGSVEIQQQIEMGFFFSNGVYLPVEGVRGQWSSNLNHDIYWSGNLDFNTRNSRFGNGIFYAGGRLGGGNYAFLSAFSWVKPLDRLFLSVSSEYLDSFGIFRQTVISTGWDITQQDKLVSRYILADTDKFFRIAYSRRVSNGANIFAVYDDDPFGPAKISLKLVMAVR